MFGRGKRELNFVSGLFGPKETKTSSIAIHKKISGFNMIEGIQEKLKYQTKGIDKEHIWLGHRNLRR